MAIKENSVPRSKKVIVTCAVTGSIHTPSMSPYLPVTAEEIIQESVAAAEAGASILHLHARDPIDGRPTSEPKQFMKFLPEIKERTDSVINITTGGGHNMTVDERLSAAFATKPEMCSLNMGSINFGIFPLAERFSHWQYPWEKAYLESTRDFIFKNTFKDIEYILKGLGAHGTKFEFECYDVGHLYNLAYFLDLGLVEPPLFIQSIFGVLGGIGPSTQHLFHMQQTADSLFGGEYHWSVLAAGRHQLGFCTMAALMGGNVRVGLEDSLYIARGRLAKSNSEQVAKIKRILQELSLEVATPEETRALLGLKGKEQVGF